MDIATTTKVPKRVPTGKRPIRTYDSALKYLFAQTDYEQMLRVRYNRDTFSLDRMRLLSKGLGDPHKKLKTAHTEAIIKAMTDAAAEMKDLPKHFARYQKDLAKLYKDKPWHRSSIWTKTR